MPLSWPASPSERGPWWAQARWCATTFRRGPLWAAFPPPSSGFGDDGLGSARAAVRPASAVPVAGLALAILGWSHLLLKGALWAAPFALLSCRIRLQGRPEGDAAWAHWTLSWYAGYLMMVVTAFGLPRFIWPFLPVLYL